MQFHVEDGQILNQRLGDSHQWNHVKVDGQWYNLDLTNDYDKKSCRFFMKSDGDRDWAECHYADKEDKYEPVHDCTSTRYDEVYREDPRQREIRELQQQKEQLRQHQINTPLSTMDDPEYVEYRQKVNALMERTPEDEYLISQFTVYKNQEQQDRCYHTLQTAKEGQEPQTLLAQDFEYSERFKKGMIEPSVVDFSRRSPISSTTLTLTEQPTQQIQQQAPQINPDVFMQQQAQMAQMQMAQAVPTLSLTMGDL